MNWIIVLTIAVILLFTSNMLQADEARWYDIDNMMWEQHIIENRVFSFITVSTNFMDAFEKSCNRRAQLNDSYITLNSLFPDDLNDRKEMTTSCDIIVVTCDKSEVTPVSETWYDNCSEQAKKVMAGIEGDDDQECYEREENY